MERDVMAGVPVGDTTLLAKLRDVVAFEAANPGSTYAAGEEAVWDALPSVVTLIEAAQRVVEEAGRYSVDGVPKSWAASRLHAALAPFVGEATQREAFHDMRRADFEREQMERADAEDGSVGEAT